MASENPFQSPKTSSLSAAPERNLMWLLFSFEGRIPRSTFWYVNLAMTGGFMLMYGLMLVPLAMNDGDGLGILGVVALAVCAILYIPAMWISLAVQVKRWHDRGKSGWWCLINFVPYIGGIWALIECGFLRGTEGSNQFGPDPI